MFTKCVRRWNVTDKIVETKHQEPNTIRKKVDGVLKVTDVVLKGREFIKKRCQTLVCDRQVC